ncbi:MULTISPECIES: hypothetical protein [unclassified Microcoleus]|uniref:hypothetical protein n=1 Tax=unclassified Microcoleus TaxID=2642155 RepID=UPI002FD01FBD
MYFPARAGGLCFCDRVASGFNRRNLQSRMGDRISVMRQSAIEFPRSVKVRSRLIPI